MAEQRHKHITFLSLGSNAGDRLKHLRYAVSEMKKLGTVASLSKIYETEPWGYDDPSAYLNMACRFDTDFEPHLLRLQLSEIEKRAGRKKSTINQNYEARTLDIDILLYDALNMNTPDLLIPHPRMALRRFVLEPLCEIAPEIIHPISGKTIRELLQVTPDSSSNAIFRNEL